MKSLATAVGNVQTFKQYFHDGKLRAKWHAGVADDGRWLLDGKATWFYQNGKKQWQVSYRLGRKVGREAFWDRDGRKLWEWRHSADGRSVWTQFWPNGRKKTESTWRRFLCDGPAIRWDQSGAEVSRSDFGMGQLRRSGGQTKTNEGDVPE
jgi:antitoxin component YwqK of YwqJK toxin-antitoxin module